MMNEKDIMDKIRADFREVFADDTPLTRDSKPGDIKAWDSMGQIRFLAKLEKTFGVKFKMKDLVTFRSIGNIADGIAKLLGSSK